MLLRQFEWLRMLHLEPVFPFSAFFWLTDFFTALLTLDERMLKIDEIAKGEVNQNCDQNLIE